MQNRRHAGYAKDTAQRGFTMLEMLIATAIFMIIGAATLSLISSQLPIFNQQQNLAEVNIALRNAVAQMQLDVANAGANYYTGLNVPNYPVGVVINNNVVASGGDCRTGTPLQYSANCFDSMSIITADAATPPTNPSNGSGGCAVTSGTTMYLAPAGTAGYTTAALATAAAANYLNGDQILVVKNDGSQYSTFKLTAAGSTATVSGNRFVTLTHTATTSITAGSPAVTYTGYNTTASGNDPYGMTTNANTMLNEQFCSTDWVLRITPIQYAVDVSNTANPVLTRTIAGGSQTAAQKVLASQIVGFKLGATLYNSTTDTTTYCFDARAYDPNCPTITAGTDGAWKYNYTLVRSVMISLIGRTTPSTSPSYKFRNAFDSGPYEIQGVSVVVNPRNMSMAD